MTMNESELTYMVISALDFYLFFFFLLFLPLFSLLVHLLYISFVNRC